MNIKQDFLTINDYSSKGCKIKSVNGIVIHYYANANTSAKNNRDFFESRKNGKLSYGAAHYLIGLQGEIIQAIPESEVAYHVGAQSYKPTAVVKLTSYPNNTTIGIECAHIKDNGEMNQDTYKSLVELTKDLLKRYRLTKNDLYLHFDITGKNCHRWFVENPIEWQKFKDLF